MLLPQLPIKIMEKMSQEGHQCYLVGGSVRDLLMSRKPADYDFVTDRKPEQIVSAALKAGWKVWKHGEAFGIINIVIGKEKFEVATMRTEGYGEDPHRPETVVFVKDIFKDLARRDFAMNAVAMDKDGKLIDPYGGVDDIKNGVIRCIGNPEARFLEDPLRVLRASRFLVQTGFVLDEKIPAAMADRDVQERFRHLSVERVKDELEKNLVAPEPSPGLRLLVDTGVLGLSCSVKSGGRKIQVDFLPEIVELDGVAQNPRYHQYDVLTHTLKTVDKVPPLLTLRWAALLHDVAKGRPGVRALNRRGEISDRCHHLAGAKMAGRILERLKVSSKDCRRVVWLIKNHRNLPDGSPQGLIRWAVKRSGDFNNRHEFMEAARQLFLLGRADDASKGRKPDTSYFHYLLSRFPKIAAGIIFYPCELKITGDDIVEKIGRGPLVGKILNDLLVDVQNGRLKNTPEALRAALQKKRYFNPGPLS